MQFRSLILIQIENIEIKMGKPIKRKQNITKKCRIQKIQNPKPPYARNKAETREYMPRIQQIS